MTTIEKAVAAVSRLTRLTQEKAVVWKQTLPSELFWTEKADEHVFSYYETIYQGRRLAIYAGRFQEDDRGSFHDYVEMVTLDQRGGVEWRFPQVAGLDTLFETVQFEAGNIDELLDDLAKVPK